MNLYSRVSCVTALDKALDSPLGKAVQDKLNQINLQEKDEYFNLKFLLFQNSFSTVQEFLDKLDNLTQNLSRAIGEGTETCIGLYQIQQMIEEDVEILISRSKKIWKRSLSFFVLSAKKVIEYIPDDGASFNQLVDKMKAERPKRYVQKKLERISEPNLERLSDDINRIKKDEDIEFITRLFMTFEPQTIRSPQYLTITLSNCSPYALRLVQNFVAKCEKNPPVLPIPPPINTTSSILSPQPLSATGQFPKRIQNKDSLITKQNDKNDQNQANIAALKIVQNYLLNTLGPNASNSAVVAAVASQLSKQGRIENAIAELKRAQTPGPTLPPPPLFGNSPKKQNSNPTPQRKTESSPLRVAKLKTDIP